MKQKKRLYLLILLVLVCLVLVVTGTYAAYTNTASVKRVVTTGIDTNAVPFSSNYLYEYNGGNYYKHIVSVPNNGTTLDLGIYNYPLKDITRFSSSDITFVLSISVVDKDGKTVNLTPPTITPDAGNYTLQGRQVSTHQFAITFSQDLVNTLKNHLVRITATSTNGLSPQKTLAADFELISASDTSSDWKGQFTDREDPSVLDAFNYEVYGTAEGTVTISWDESYVTLSKWSRDDLALGSTGNPISFDVGGENQPTSYLLQFYRLRGRTESDGWPNIKVTFTESSSSSTP